MIQESIFIPLSMLALLTFLVALLIPIKRFRAAFARQVGPGDFRYGESAKVPGDVALPNRNYMNLLELPLLFYILVLAVYVTKRVDTTYVALAWGFVASRVVHSIIHLSYNNVMHRLTAFAVGAMLLMVMWVRFLTSLL